MKKALIISFYYYPLNGVPTYRISSWVDHLPKYGIRPTLLTRHYFENDSTWENVIKNNEQPPSTTSNGDHEIIRLPYRQSTTFRTSSWLHSRNLKFLSKGFTFLTLLCGEVEPEIDGYRTFKGFLEGHLKKVEYDYVIITSPPLNLFRLGEMFKNKCSCLLYDFRDFENRFLFGNGRLPLGERLTARLKVRFARKWAKHADVITTISEPFAQKLQRLTNKNSLVVTNGYEKEIFDEVKTVKNAVFSIRIVGTVYKEQDIDLFISGVKKFLEHTDDLRIELVGVTKYAEERISEGIGSKFVNVKRKVEKSKAVWYMKNADILFYPAWRGYRGIYSTKIFEYIASGSHVLIAPGDADVIEQLVREFNAGSICNTVEEVVNCLLEEYQKFLLGNNKRIVPGNFKAYSREELTGSLANILHENSKHECVN
jgi:glycosyltransferase involved in cell wall biosynthesis